MIKNIENKVLKIVVFFFLLSIFSFVVVKLVPGDPVMSMLRIDDIAASNQQIEELREQLGLNKPLVIQYFDWMSKVIKLDFGNSLITGKPVVKEIMDALPSTIMLGSISMLISIIISVVLGSLAAFYRNGVIDKLVTTFIVVGSSIPGFCLGFILVDIFSVRLQLLPSMGMGSTKHIILPALTMGISMAPTYTKLIRNSLVESLDMDFVKSARARGVHEKNIFIYHVIRNSLIPIITVFGLSFGSLIGGTVIIEVLFSYSGIGHLAIVAIKKRDYALIQAFILLVGIASFIINEIVDFSYKFIDPSTKSKEAISIEKKCEM